MQHWPHHHNDSPRQAATSLSSEFPRSDDDQTSVEARIQFKHHAETMASLLQHPGWKMVKKISKPSIKTRIMDTDDREAFLYEAIRAQAIMEVLQLPAKIIKQHQQHYPAPNSNPGAPSENGHP